MKFEVTVNSDHLSCVAFGSSDDVRDAIGYFPELVGRCRGAGIYNVLVDMRNVEGFPSATGRIIFFEEIINQHDTYVDMGGVPLRMAFLWPASKLTSYSPGVEIAKLRGFAAATMTDLDEALAWLRNGDAGAGQT